ncbi:MAG: hypothetical protein HC896_01820 [Bacteroidales bacterium]|nr:hypothetical protein [Bacteroidales bacterium]
MHFVEKAFEDSLAVQNQFGKEDIDKARNNQFGMALIMENQNKTARKYQS